ncbi:hypothetical protein BBF96_03130 [Anoxybacter fermentans]|uniref:Major facilitator superfamily (MFS) profile domain-containing protein n=1 Tax=Anoxybacter fermentans TaxID=1323375 RepID=A0A3Q9HP28_9FIRM|nr:hypothetical protein BBF96_03130 [Anoxybacter fermentans]
MLDLFDSGLALGILMMFATLPGVIFGPFSGVLVDRVNRKKLIIIMDFVRGIIILVLTQLLLLDRLLYLNLLIGTFLMSICSTIFNPAISALISNLVDDENLSKANSLENLSRNLTGILGAALGGLLLGFYGVAGIFFLNGISFLLSAILEIYIQMSVLVDKNK